MNSPVEAPAPLPAGFETLPVFAEGRVIPGASPEGVLGANGIRAYRHIASAVRVVIFAAPGPLVSATIIVGTEPVSHAGHPHTLEHIVFLGSKKYPDRGYLDNLACRCLSDGTNAWTDDEYTAYTATTAGLDGFLHLLPCYLDHIMRPNINRAAFDSEVYHVRGDGKEAGVVFCEMQARENTEDDLSWAALHSVLYEDTPLSLTAGGLCKHIRSLTNEDIARFHKDQYCGSNVSVVVGGSNVPPHTLLSSIKPLLDEISSVPGYHPGTPRWQIPLHIKPLPPLTRKICPFPSGDHSIGAISLAWRGPGIDERKDKAAIVILLRYLAEDVWSPLRQQFVEVKDQLASDIATQQEEYFDSGSFSLTFEGVEHLDDHEEDEEEDGSNVSEESSDDNDDDNDDDEDSEEEHNGPKIDGMKGESKSNGHATKEKSKEDSFLLSGKLEKQVMQFLRDICEKGELPGGLSAIHVAIKKEKESDLSQLESGSHSVVPYDLIDELVYGDRASSLIGEGVRGFLSYYDALKEMNEAYWISALRRYMVDAPIFELVMVPDEELAEKQAEDERLLLGERLNRFGKEALTKLGKENEERIASLKALKFKADVFPPIPSTMNISRFPYTVSPHKRACYTGQCVALETDFIHCSIFIDSKRLNLEQRMLLPVLCELIPTCDIRLEDGCYTAYTDHARAFSEATIDEDGSGVFLGYSSGMAHQCVVVHFMASPESFEEAANLMLISLFQSEVTAERVAAVSQSWLANCTSEMRDGECVNGSQSLLIPYMMSNDRRREEAPNFVFSSFVSLYPLLSFLSEEFSSKKPKNRLRQKTVSQMQNVLDTVRHFGNDDVFVQITAREPEKADDILAKLWEGKVKKFGSGHTGKMHCESNNMDVGRLALSRRVGETIDEMLQGQVVGKITGIGGVESSFLQVTLDLPVYIGHSDWGALSVLLEMLCRIEGPLSDAVRVSGLAYGASIRSVTWHGQLTLDIYDSSSLAAAWNAATKCLQDLRHELEGKDEDGLLGVELDTAKAAMLFNLSQGRSCANSIAGGALARCALGAPASPMADQTLEGEVERVTLFCLKRVFDLYLRKIYEGGCGRLFAVVCGLSVVQKTVDEFGKCKWPVRLEECSIESMYPKEVGKLIKKLSS